MRRVAYGSAIREGFEWLLATYPNVFTIGQGLWSPWYVGNSMTDLDTQFGVQRVIDTPTSELGVTGAGLGAALCGYRPVVIHLRVDFMLLAVDQIVTQAAKWRYMFGGDIAVPLTVRGIINRGGEQGAQHSQALHSWFAHVPGLRVVMPATARDARDLLIASVLSDDPVLYIDDRWLYEVEEDMPPPEPVDLMAIGPAVVRVGTDVTLVGAGHTTKLCLDAAARLSTCGVSAEVVDLRVLNPLDRSTVIKSVDKTGRVLAVDGDWKSCGLAAEILASIAEARSANDTAATCGRITLPDAPAPTSRPLEEAYYITVDDVVEASLALIQREEQGVFAHRP